MEGTKTNTALETIGVLLLTAGGGLITAGKHIEGIVLVVLGVGIISIKYAIRRG